jgi:hypothetical protein
MSAEKGRRAGRAERVGVELLVVDDAPAVDVIGDQLGPDNDLIPRSIVTV